MNKTIFTILLCFIISCSASAQENQKQLADSLQYTVVLPDEHAYPFGDSLSETEWYAEREKDFKDYPPLRQLQCGLWINNLGDIAFKEIGYEVDGNDTIRIDSATVVSIPNRIPVDQYLTWTYHFPVNMPDNITEDEVWSKYTPALKNVVDTASFKILSGFFFIDKNFIYSYNPMACGGHIFVQNGLDRKTFRVFGKNSVFACDKNSCYVMGEQIEGADPKTFRVILDEEYLISRDKNHFYNWNDRMTDKQVRELEDELGIDLFTHANALLRKKKLWSKKNRFDDF